MRLFLWIFLIVFCANCFAQVQQGVVKTRGRMVDGKLVPGEKLSGATISLNFGNVLVSNKQGYFSFKVPKSNTFSLVSASKKGYVLADPEYVKRSFTYSAENPFYVVLEDENQRQADINVATRKVRKTLSAQLAKQEEEIESLKEQKKLSEKEYQDRLAKLYDDQTKSERLVKEMAERYASTDYDQLDEFNRQVQLYIEEGELQKADSMICSKGDVEKRVSEYHGVVAANKKIRDYLEKSEAGASKTYEELSQDLYYRHEIFYQKMQYDSAGYYLTLRVNLDTTNLRAVLDAEARCWVLEPSDCVRMENILLDRYVRDGDFPNIAKTQSMLGLRYDMCFRDTTKAGAYYRMSIKTIEEILNHEQKAEVLANMAESLLPSVVHFVRGKDTLNGKKYFEISCKIYEQLFNQYPDSLDYRENLAEAYDILGYYYSKNQSFFTSEKYYKIALENYEFLSKKHSNRYHDGLVDVLKSLGDLYRLHHDFEISASYFKRALNLQEDVVAQDSGRYAWDKLAEINVALGNLYNDIHDSISSEKYYKRALACYDQLTAQDLELSGVQLANVYIPVGDFYQKYRNYEASNSFYKKASKIIESVNTKVGNRSKEYLPERQKRLADIKKKLSLSFACMKKFEKAMQIIDEAIALVPTNPEYFDTKGEIFLMQGKNAEALEMWNMVQELDSVFLQKHPDGTGLSNGLKKLGLIK